MVLEAGLYYYRARYYSPTLGRFLQTDPTGSRDELNLYQYTRNSPINSVDATGEETGAAFSSINRYTSPIVSGSGSPTMLLDPIPIIGDIKGAIEAIENPTIPSIVASAVGILPGGDLLKPLLKNSDVVVRGGADIPGGGNSVEGIQAGTSTNPATGITGFSAQASPGATVCDLCKSIPNNQVGVTTAGDIRAAGGDVLPTGNVANPSHVTVTGLTAEDANRLLTPTRSNPVPPNERLRR